VNRSMLEFDTPDLAEWLWPIALALGALALARWLLFGRWPRSWFARLAISAGAVVACFALAISEVFRFDGSTHLWACLVLGVLAVGFLVSGYRRTTRSIRPALRISLMTLRLLLAIVAMIVLTRPVFKSVAVTYEKAVLGLAVDVSGSMHVRDAALSKAGGRETNVVSRIEAVRHVMAANDAGVEALSNAYHLRGFSFDTEITQIDIPSAIDAGDGFTAFSDALDEIRRDLIQTGDTLAGIIIISDGNDNFSVEVQPIEIAQRLNEAGVPLYAVGVGDEAASVLTSSLRGRRLDAPAIVSLANRLPVHAEFVASGLAGRGARIRLLFDDTLVDERELVIRDARELVRVDLSTVPETVGSHRLTVQAEVPDLEIAAELSQFVQVADDKTRVLYVDRARYERATIARALESVPTVRLTKVDLDRPARAGVSLALPREINQWLSYHVILIGDVDRSVIPKSALRSIRELIRTHGRGVALLGGVRTLGSGKYGKTVLQDAFGVDLAAVGQLEGPQPFELTSAGRSHPICRLDDGVWERLPPFAGASRIVVTSPIAETLMQTTRGDPLLIVQEGTAGRTAVVAFDSTWQWPFVDDDGADAQKRFWRQLVFWLAGQQAKVWVASGRPRYDLVRLWAGREQLNVTAGVTLPESAETSSDVAISGTLIDPAGERTEIPWVRKEDQFAAGLTVDSPGDYRLEVKATLAGRPIGRADSAFTVEQVDLERLEPAVDFDTLKRMSAETASVGGRYVPLSDLGALIDQLLSTPTLREIEHVNRLRLVDDWPWGWFGVFLALLILEWALRRRASLI